MDGGEHLIVPMLQGFVWLDEGLQNYLRAQGWPRVTRPQSMLMALVAQGVRRPSEIARNLGVSRQAVHTTLGRMVELGILALVDDPEDRRSKLVVISERGAKMRECAQRAMLLMAQELRSRIGAKSLGDLQAALAAEWGPPMDWGSASAIQAAE